MIGQHVWRYHPEKKRFEIFAEGGGNAFGVEIDDAGRIYSGHNGGDTRGFHYVQGGSYRKGFEKHGVLANPYSFGFFEAMKPNKSAALQPHFRPQRSATACPTQYRGKLFAVEPLQGRVMLTDMTPDRSSFQTKDLGPRRHAAATPGFGPVDIKPAPDGSIFVADFYEAEDRRTWGTTTASIDRDTGRIYRLAAKDAKFHKPVDLGKKTSAELVELLKIATIAGSGRRPMRLLGDRKDRSALPDAASDAFREQAASWPSNRCGRSTSTGGLRRGLRREVAWIIPSRRSAPVDGAAARRTIISSATRYPPRSSSLTRRSRASTFAASGPRAPERLSAAEGLPIVAELADARRGRRPTFTCRCCCGGRSSRIARRIATRCSTCSANRRFGGRRSSRRRSCRG